MSNLIRPGVEIGELSAGAFESGFTLVETAIVLLIIVLLLSNLTRHAAGIRGP